MLIIRLDFLEYKYVKHDHPKGIKHLSKINLLQDIFYNREEIDRNCDAEHGVGVGGESPL